MPEITLDNRSFSLLEYIYNNPYISYASLKTAFPSYNDIEDLVLSFDEQHLISLREASSLETDTDQYETYNLVDSSHLVTITFGNAIIEQAKRRTDEFNTKLKPLYDIADKTTSLAESASIRQISQKNKPIVQEKHLFLLNSKLIYPLSFQSLPQFAVFWLMQTR